MRFWGSSAIVPLCMEQPATPRARALVQEDPDMVAWWGSLLECWSAIARLRRDGIIALDDEEQARRRLDDLQRAWQEVQPGEDLRLVAGRLLRVHPLTVAEALQLAAALAWAGAALGGEVVTFDRRLQDAARLEGLSPVF